MRRMPDEAVFLGIEGGGTRTVAVLVDRSLQVLERQEFGPGNLRLLSDERLAGLFREIAASLPVPVSIGIGLAGLRDAEDEGRARAAAAALWPGIPLALTNDLETALLATDFGDEGALILVLSGTGSCCYGKAGDRRAKVGGWGHLLGDLASGYDIAFQALRATVSEYDRNGRWGALGVELLRSTLLNTPEDLIAWVQTADKRTIARLASAVFAAAGRDPLAALILENAGERLAGDALLCAERLNARPACFVLAGGVLQNQPAFASRVARQIQKQLPGAKVELLAAEGALGAARLALRTAREGQARGGKVPAPLYVPGFNPVGSPTEMRNPNSARLDQMTIPEAVDLMLEEEKVIIPALRTQKGQIARAVELVSAALREEGRLFYAGAGTSGRLGVLDASECPPTFRVSPERVQGIIAGGQRALWEAVEGAEDNARGGAAAIAGRKVAAADVVIGIAASGRTPFVWGAFAEARKRGARTVLICFNPGLEIDPAHAPDLIIAPNVGPEVLTGSTRLKAGTATKLILNMITTLSMVQLGKVAGNLMIDLNPSNVKLRDRAIRIVRELARCTGEEAQAALEKNQWVVKEAWRSLELSKAGKA